MDQPDVDITARYRALEDQSRSLAEKCGHEGLRRQLLAVAEQWKHLRLMMSPPSSAARRPAAKHEETHHARD